MEKKTKATKRSSSENKRKLSPYELNLIFKAGFDPEKVLLNIEADEPIEYYLGIARFRNALFKVNNHTLIPRPETEEIIDIALEPIISSGKTSDITFADIGTGSGAIGICFAEELKLRGIPYKGYLSDISKDALKIAKDNAKKFLVEDLEIFKSDLLSNYPKNIKFDLIFANLPYIPSARILELDNSVKNYEPLTALDGGQDGLSIIEVFLEQAVKYIKDEGVLLLEVDDTHTKIPDEILSKFQGSIIADSNDNCRFWKLHKR